MTDLEISFNYLRQYVAHMYGCEVRLQAGMGLGVCTCGMEDCLKALEDEIKEVANRV